MDPAGIEGLGEAVTGGLAARALEPHAGEGHEGHGAGGACLNCGTALNGPYCHQCGQPAHVHRTVGAFWHDVAHSVLHFEGKIWRTLPLLAWRPGELTRRYIQGERARFVSPMALFLFSVFMMFAVISALGGPFQVDSKGERRADARQELKQEQDKAGRKLARLTRRREQAVAAGEPTREIDADIAEVKRDLAVEVTIEETVRRATGEDAPSEVRSGSEESKATGESKGKLTIARTGVPKVDAALAKAESNPELILYKLQSTAYKFSWALIPISVPFLWLLFLHRRRYWQYKAFDHMVFITYSIAFMSLGFVALTLLKPFGLGDAIPGLAITFVPPLHIYRQLRGAYRLSRFSAVWRTMVLIAFAFVAAGLFLTILLMIGVLG